MPAVLTAMTAAGAILLPVAAVWKDKDPRGLVVSAAVLVAALAVSALVHFGFAQEHRIFIDEDAYASIAHNTAAGLAGHLTLGHSPQSSRTISYKGPIAFPVLAGPWIWAFGSEAGPALLIASLRGAPAGQMVHLGPRP